MKNTWQILTVLLAIALLVLSVKLAIEGTEEAPKANPSVTSQVSSQSNEQIILDAIMTRSSVRNFTSEVVEDAKIERLLRAGMSAPSGGNKQPWELMVITDRTLLDAIPPIVKGAHMAAKAPLAIAVLGSPEKALIPDYWIQDCAAVTQNILLAAHGMGLGAVWCGAFPENGTNRVEAITKLLQLPEGVHALSIIVIGYPEGEQFPKDKWDAEKVHYNGY